jgi:hypothetical protein
VTATLFEVTAADVVPTNNDWYTPRWVFDAAGLTFDLDVAAPVDPDFRTCPALRYLTVLDDGLTAPWDGLIWMNPPFSGPAPWADRFAGHPEGLALMPALPRAKSLGVLMSSADAFALINPDFGRPDGTTGILRWPMALVAKGAACVDALGRIARADRQAVGSWFVRPS